MFYLLHFTIYHLPFTLFDVHGSWLMAGKSLVSLAALLVEILDMGREGEEEGHVITEVTLTFRVWGFRVEPILLIVRIRDAVETLKILSLIGNLDS